MQFFLKTIFFYSLVLLLTSFNTEKDWQLEKSKNGITVYTYLAEGESIKQIRSHTTIKTSLSSLVSVLYDATTYTDWIYKCSEAKILKQLSDKKMVYYTVNDAPWPVLDRELYVVNNFYQEEKTGVVYSVSKPLPNNKIPVRKNKVRVNDFYGEWKFTPLKGGEVAVDYYLKLDPSGTLPAWVINMTLEIGPYQSLLAFKKEVLKSKHQKTTYNFINEPKN